MELASQPGVRGEGETGSQSLSQAPKESLRTLLGAAIDYAGLFPPARLAIEEAVRLYGRYRRGAHAWALGRFVVRADRLEELEGALAGPSGPAPGEPPWPLAVLLVEKPETGLQRVSDFRKHRFSTAETARAVVEAVEWKISSPEMAERLAALLPPGLPGYAEIPLQPDPQALLELASRKGFRAKIRTGGEVADHFPSPSSLARFLAVCAWRKVAFKATAGLHLPLRVVRPLDSSPGSPRVPMHGFINLILAAGLALSKEADPRRIEELLEDTDAQNFALHPDGASWRGDKLGLEQLRALRQGFFHSFGSCSFEEPLEGLVELGWL